VNITELASQKLHALTLIAGGSSSPMAFPSSSPAKTPRRGVQEPMDGPPDSDPLDFPSLVSRSYVQLREL
jgi:hypothetical protein